ncbi:MAG: hypothetical protein AB1757_17820 [Acidobacteriota bacterium]
MRKTLFILLFGALFFSACADDTVNKNTTPTNSNSRTPSLNENITPVKNTSSFDPNSKSCNPYFPLRPGTSVKYTLQYSSPLVAEVTVVTDAAEENGQKVFIERTQIVDKSGGYEKNELSTRKYICEDGRIKILSEKTENKIQGQASVFEHKFRGVPYLLVDPSALEKKGSTWTVSFTQTISVGDQPPMNPAEPIIINFESQGEEEIKTPAGTFKAWRVARKIKEAEVYDYYVKGLGLVKRASKEGTNWEMKEYAGLQPDPKSVVEK